MSGDTLTCFRYQVNQKDPDISGILDISSKCTIQSQLLSKKDNNSVYAITILGPSKDVYGTRKTILQRNPSTV
jgi:hypothetical protein